MGSSDTLRENQGAAERVCRSDREIDEYWVSVVVEEPVSDDLKVLVRADLKKAWHFRRDMCQQVNPVELHSVAQVRHTSAGQPNATNHRPPFFRLKAVRAHRS